MIRVSMRRGGAFLAGALVAVALPGLPLTAATALAPDPTLASGGDWAVTRAAGGYEVTVDLAQPLPIKSDAPTIVVDGEAIGIATESADGKSLSVFTTDPGVTQADDIEAGWASQSDRSAAAFSTAVAEVPEAAAAPLPVDPAEHGSFDWTESIYKFGEQSIDLAAIGGVLGELEGKLYLPTTGGARPTVILLHGRHTSCYGDGDQNPLRWPCPATPTSSPARLSIPSYLGYDGTARALASNGYSVVSISANSVNANDNQLAADQGAQARGQLILDTLTMLSKANAGQSVSYYDAWMDRTVTLDQALTDGTAALAEREPAFLTPVEPLDTVTPAGLVGKFDLSNIGMMGHSRGGEGVTSAAVLNNALADPWAINSILPLAPVDFGRMTVPDVPMNVILPYCDGDVSNQQGQHMLDDSRYAYDDDALRSGVWAMGANHNFYNTVWTPGLFSFSVSDDWSGSSTRRVEPICGTDEAVAATSIRMTAAEQYDMGTSYMAGWFRLTLGAEDQFLPMFDGSGQVPAALNGEDVRSVSTAPASKRNTISTLEDVSSLVRTFGTATANPCASLSGRTVPQQLPACSSSGSSTVPHWTPASNGGNVPATPLTRMMWSSGTGEVRVSVPTASRDASGFERLSVKVAADETVVTGTDLTLSVVDGAGSTWTGLVSALNPQALVRLPTSATTTGLSTLKKIVLQQVNVPVASLVTAGLDPTDVREVRFTAAVGADEVTSGAAYLSDLAFESSSIGTAAPGVEPVVDVYAPNVDEGNGPGTVEMAVYLDQPTTAPVTGYASLIGSTTSRAGASMAKVTFAAGETCKVVTSALQGDSIASTTNASTLKASVINTQGAVMGKQSVVFTSVREDDGTLPTGNPAVAPPVLPPYGVPGPVCAELASVQAGGTLAATPATPGADSEVTGGGFRSGEAVTISGDGLTSVTVIADGDGAIAASVAVPGDVPPGSIALSAVAAGTGRTLTGDLSTLTPTTTTLTWSPSVIEIGRPVTFTATVDGGEGPVEFFDGTTSLGTVSTVSGVATLEVPGFGAGQHSVTAVFGETATSMGSTSNAVSFLLDKSEPSVMFTVSPSTTVFGTGAVGTVVVGGATEGEVELSIGTGTATLPVDSTGTVSFPFARKLAAGSYTMGARYLGSPEVEASGVVTTTYVVTKAPTSLKVSAPAKAKRGSVVKVSVKVSGRVVGVPITGTIIVKVTGSNGKTKTKVLTTGSGDLATFTVRASTSGKKFKVKATFRPTGSYSGSGPTVRKVLLR